MASGRGPQGARGKSAAIYDAAIRTKSTGGFLQSRRLHAKKRKLQTQSRRRSECKRSLRMAPIGWLLADSQPPGSPHASGANHPHSACGERTTLPPRSHWPRDCSTSVDASKRRSLPRSRSAPMPIERPAQGVHFTRYSTRVPLFCSRESTPSRPLPGPHGYSGVTSGIQAFGDVEKRSWV